MFLRLLAIVFCGTLVSSCFDPPEYPDIPEISFKSVNFVKGGLDSDGNPVSDTVVLLINFKDGNGDVGVGTDEVYPPFNDRWYYTKEPLSSSNSAYDDCTSYDHKCWFLRAGTEADPFKEVNKYVDFSDRRTNPNYDTLSKYGFSKPYNCINWEVVYYDDDNNDETEVVPVDTLFFTLNPHYSNIFVQFEIKNPNPPDLTNPFDSKFEENVYFTYPICGVRTFDGRVPVLFDETTKDTPLEGTIRYAMPSSFYKTIFASNTLRLRVYIEDRALNKSNEIVTSEFTVDK